MNSSASVGFAIIGAGFIGRKRAAALGGGSRLVRVFDIDEAAAFGLAATVPGCRVAGSLDDLFADPDVNVVIVATTHDRLAELSLRAIEADKHVFVEKPAGTTLVELELLAAAAATKGLRVGVGFNHRFHPAIVKAKEVIETHDVGRLLWVRGRYGHGGRVGYEREWRAVRARSGGGELIDQGSHLIDLSRYLVGDLDLRFAHTPTLFWDTDVEDNAFLALDARQGGFVWLHASWTEWKNLFCFEIAFERIKIEVNGLGGSYGTERISVYQMAPEMGPPSADTWEFPSPDSSWSAELTDFVSSMSSEPSEGANIDDAIASMRIVQAAYSS